MDSYLLWEPPEGTLSILVSRSVLERLQHFAGEAFTSARPDAGAVLLGHSEELADSGRRVVTVENFQSGVSRLHDSSVVGFVRCRAQKALHLDPSDFRMLKSSPDLVCLMVRPEGNGAPAGGFFYREGKTVRYPRADMQFAISPHAVDCRGLLFVREREHAEDADVERQPRNVRKRLTFAAVGLALMLAPAAFWMVSRAHQQGTNNEPPAIATTPAAAVSEPAPVSHPRLVSEPAVPERAPLARHSRLRHGRKLSKHVR